MNNINRVVLTGNLTADPELRPLPSGTSVGRLRLAVNTRRKNSQTGDWGDAQLLRRDGLRPPGRELRPLPGQGPADRRRRAPGMARVAPPRTAQAPVGRGDRQRRPFLASAAGRRGRRVAQRRQPATAAPSDTGDFDTAVPAGRPATTTSRSEERDGVLPLDPRHAARRGRRSTTVKVGREAGVVGLGEQRTRTLDAGFGDWFAGLTDGEGNFSIHRIAGTYFRPSFAIKLRDDNTAILKEIQTQLGLGAIYREVNRRGNRNPCRRWVVQSRTDAQELVEILDRYPLRSRKAADYAIWQRAVAQWSTMPRGKRWCGHRDWAAMVELKEQLESVRKYLPPTSLEVELAGRADPQRSIRTAGPPPHAGGESKSGRWTADLIRCGICRSERGRRTSYQ